MLERVRRAEPNTLLQFKVPSADCDKARRALWRVAREWKARGVKLETNLGRHGDTALNPTPEGQIILYVYLRPTKEPQLCPHCGQAI